MAQQTVLSRAASVAKRSIHGQVITIIRRGDLCEGRGTEKAWSWECPADDRFDGQLAIKVDQIDE
jgi:hypothetical protein